MPVAARGQLAWRTGHRLRWGTRLIVRAPGEGRPAPGLHWRVGEPGPDRGACAPSASLRVCAPPAGGGTIGAVTRYLLLPDDEREFVDWAQGSCGLILLGGDRLWSGEPQPAGLAGLPAELPGPPEPGVAPASALELLLWDRGWGVNNLPGWDGQSAGSRVRGHLTEAAAKPAGMSVDELIDLERTRVLRLRRSGWTWDGALRVAALQGSARPSRLQDQAVMRVLRAAERWMRHGATEISLPETFRFRPRVLARPGAAAYVGSGGVVYPWDA